jgi:hypothetical protein
MKVGRFLTDLALLAGSVPFLAAAQLNPEALKAWDEHLRDTDKRMQARLEGRQSFLWTDESPDRKQRVRRGEVVVAPGVEHGTQSVTNGLIHDWMGAVFIPGATIESLFRVTHDYNRYKEIYKPVVTDSKVLACSTGRQEFTMVCQRRVLFVNAAMEGHYQSHDVAINAHRGYSILDATQVQQFENYGTAGAHLLPPDTGSGYVWRVRSIARYEERDGGLYLEVEAMALTRDIPASLRWLVNPIVNHLSVNSLTATLIQTRDAVNAPPSRPEGVAACPPRPRTLTKSKSSGEE